MVAPVPPTALARAISYSTMLIRTELGTGTGFIVSFAVSIDRVALLLITNRHVVEGASSCHLHFTTMDPVTGERSADRFHDALVSDASQAWIFHPTEDLAALPFTGVRDQLVSDGVHIHYIAIDDNTIATEDELLSIEAAEDIIMVGYPSGIWDEANNMPVFRRGTTATAPALDLDGRKEFLIDCAVYPGSSGSPIFLFNIGGYLSGNQFMLGASRIKLIGVLSSGHSVDNYGHVVAMPAPLGVSAVIVPSMMNLGICIKSTQLEWFRTHFAGLAAAQAEIPATP